jgi:ABC-2 type transport system permease protein
VTTFAAARLVLGREIRAKLRDKAFLFSTVSFLFIIIASIAVPSLIEGGPTRVAVADGGSAAALRQAGFEIVEVPDTAAAERLVRDGDVEAAVVPGPRVVGLDETPEEVVEALSTAPQVRLLDELPYNRAVAILVPLAIAMLCYLTSLLFGLQIAQSVVEEKATRIVEILVSSVSPRALLAGKVAAMSILAFAQIALLAVVTVVGLMVTGTDAGLLDVIAPALGWFLPFFVLGFVMLATIWAAVGALAARQEDLGSTSGTAQMIVLIPFFAVIFLRDNPAALTALSYFPLSSPMAMPIRIFQQDAAGWEPFAALAIVAVTAALLLGVGARIYEGSLLRTNTRTSIAAAWRTRSTAG